MTSTVYIAKNVYGGDGLGRLGDGRVVFVPGAWAGEQVKAEIIEEKRSYVKARLVEVIEPARERIDGGFVSGIPGCVYADISPKGEMAAKESQLKEFFERAHISAGEIRTSPLADEFFFNYRNKVVYHFDVEDGRLKIGYRQEPSHRIIDITSDPLAVAAINEKLPEIRRTVGALAASGPMSVRRDIIAKGNVTVRWSEKTGVKWWMGDPPRDQSIKETTMGLDFEVPAGGFYQVNPRVGDELVKTVAAEYHKRGDDLGELVDLYCGVGVFGLSLKPRRLFGIESGRTAVEYARRNAERQRFDNARFFASEVGRNMRRIRIDGDSTVIVDPPRGGLERGVARWLGRSNAKRIFYVSCDVATLVRDLKDMLAGYNVTSAVLFNMFPRTARFETLVTLERKES